MVCDSSISHSQLKQNVPGALSSVKAITYDLSVTFMANPLIDFQSTFSSEIVAPSFGQGSTQFTYHLPNGRDLMIQIPAANEHRLFAHRQWRAGLRAAELVLSTDLSEKSILELGAGTGLPGLSALVGTLHDERSSPKIVVLSDYDDAMIIQTLRQNVLRNVTYYSDLQRIKVIAHNWGSDPEDLTQSVAFTSPTNTDVADNVATVILLT